MRTFLALAFFVCAVRGRRSCPDGAAAVPAVSGSCLAAGRRRPEPLAAGADPDRKLDGGYDTWLSPGGSADCTIRLKSATVGGP